MTREQLIRSDEYITTTIDCVVVSNKSVRKMRTELNEFFINYRNELLSQPQPEDEDITPPCLNKGDGIEQHYFDMGYEAGYKARKQHRNEI